jgi:hypothetical protein
MSQPSQTIEWTLEAAWIAALQASSALVAMLAAATSIVREYDMSAGVADVLPKVLVCCPGAKPTLARGDGWYETPLRTVVVTSLDDDPTGSSRAAIAGAVRDVFEGSGLLATLQAAAPTLEIRMFEQRDAPKIQDYIAAGKPTRQWDYEYLIIATMKVGEMTTTTTTTTTTAA